MRAPEFVPERGKRSRLEPGLSGGTSLKTDHGTYVQADGGGGSELIHAARVAEHSEAAETFFPSRPLIRSMAGPACRRAARCMPAACASRATSATRTRTGRRCRCSATTATGSASTCATRATSAQPRPDAGDGLRRRADVGLARRATTGAGGKSGRASRARVLGDRSRVLRGAEGARDGLVPDAGRLLSRRASGTTRGGSSAGWGRRCGPTCRRWRCSRWRTRSRDTTPGWDAGTCAQMAAEFHGACPEVTIRLLSAYTGHEDVAITNDYSRDPATAFTVHGYRGGHWWDKVRPHLQLRLRAETEAAPRLAGRAVRAWARAVSVTENQHELTDGPLMAMAAMSLMTRQGVGLLLRAGRDLGRGRDVRADAGLRVRALGGGDAAEGRHAVDRRALPRRRHLGQLSGCSSRTGETRCDHARARTRAVVCLIYGPRRWTTRRSAGRSTSTHDLAGAAKLIIGHY